jgi:UDP-GlcNAc:undecaprenyl-phosphate/decaprenyl-phosphate GlcNAc-1-phosphate transferase
MFAWQARKSDMFNSSIWYIFGAFFSSLVLTPVMARYSRGVTLLCVNTIPVTGGISFFLSWLLWITMSGLLSHTPFRFDIIGIVIASILLFVGSVFDDLCEQTIIHKLIVQLVAIIVVIAYGVQTHIVGLGYWGNMALSIGWLLLVTNAFNLLDITDGVAAVTGWLIGLVFALYAYSRGDIQMAVTVFLLCAVITGFLPYNMPSAKVYMGNSGSHVIGFILASVALVLSYAQQGHTVALLSPLFILALPLYDTAFVCAARIRNKKNPLKKSNDHIALRLKAGGYSAQHVLLWMTGLCVLLCAIGVMLSCVSNAIGIVSIGVMATFLYFLTGYLNKSRCDE